MREALTRDLGILVLLSAALSARDEEAVDAALGEALAHGVDPVGVEEAILQSYLFLGYPAALNGFARWRSVSGRGPAPPMEDDPDLWQERGERVCSAVYGHRYPALRENIRALHPDMERWMVQEGYGKVLGRSGLSLVWRECCIVAILAVQGVFKQLHSHLRGALQVGGTPEEISSVLEVVRPFQAPPAAEAVARTWDEVRLRWMEAGASPGSALVSGPGSATGSAPDVGPGGPVESKGREGPSAPPPGSNT